MFQTSQFQAKTINFKIKIFFYFSPPPNPSYHFPRRGDERDHDGGPEGGRRPAEGRLEDVVDPVHGRHPGVGAGGAEEGAEEGGGATSVSRMVVVKTVLKILQCLRYSELEYFAKKNTAVLVLLIFPMMYAICCFPLTVCCEINEFHLHCAPIYINT